MFNFREKIKYGAFNANTIGVIHFYITKRFLYTILYSVKRYFMFELSYPLSEKRQLVTENYACDEVQAMHNLSHIAYMSEIERTGAARLAKKLMSKIRADRHKQGGVDALMQEFSLSSEEGIALMCLAEALLRVPDKLTRDKLIQDKLSGGDWKGHIHNSHSLFVNAAAWGLLVTGKLVDALEEDTLSIALTRVVAKGGQPLIRQSVDFAMRILGKQFVTGKDIKDALANGKAREKKGYTFSFDMLGEAALTEEDANRYYEDYVTALHALGKDSKGAGVYKGNGLSIKISAIFPRYWRAQHERIMTELLPRVKSLLMLAKQYDIGLNIDAEEASRLELSFDLMEALVSDPDLAGFKGIGFVVQAYQKRAPYAIDYLIDLARRNNQRIMIRLVKGAYWDSEIKWAQEDGYKGYPVYTRKVHSDISYLACARKLFDAQDAVYPQFATHNAYSLSAVYEMGKDKEFEFQCLHGMGETLYDLVVGKDQLDRQCRIYAPVGSHETLLAYLVRRLLENGANSSFVNQILDDSISIDELVSCPLDALAKTKGLPHEVTPLPAHIYGKKRINSAGINFDNELYLADLEHSLKATLKQTYIATSLTAIEVKEQKAQPILNPADKNDVIGSVCFIDPESLPHVIDVAIQAQTHWAQTPITTRATYLRQFSDLLEENTALFIMIALREAGKTYKNAIAEIREAVDFCRYYAAEAEEKLSTQTPLGTVVTISPWNFPLAIFIGELSSALVAGNTVIAKPAEQTALIAYAAVKLLHQVGVPKDTLQLVLGAGDIGDLLTQNKQINGVIFTGSTQVAKSINKNLAKNTQNPILIAETGGQNAMIVDSTALPEQVCEDVIHSAFDSAGQRCSALRVLCLQDDIADHMLNMIKGAMDQLVIGNPTLLNTDVGPVIDSKAQANLIQHIEKVKKSAQAFHEVNIDDKTAQAGTFVAPILFELNNLDELNQEVFGPVLHVIRYQAKDIDALIDQINSKGFALTHGIHSRIDSSVQHIVERIEAGNIYINRNIVGAVVGVQPFGGHGLSGTGPKAGGPFYLQRLTQKTQWETPKMTVEGTAAKEYLPMINALLTDMNFDPDTQSEIKADIQNQLITNLNGASVELQGVTGEINTLFWRAPKMAYIVNGHDDLAQAFVAFIKLTLSNIKTAVTADHPLAAWKEKAQCMIQIVDKAQAATITHWISLSTPTTTLKIELAQQPHQIIKLIDASVGLDISQIFYEISCSNNITASGGNAKLMLAAK